MPGVSIPPFLTLPDGVTATAIETGLGPIAALDTETLTPEPSGSALLVPGFTGSKEDFIAAMVPIAKRGIRAVAIDLPGQFESPVADHSPSLGGLAAAVWAAASDLPRPLVLVGHSFGGLVVREAVLADPLASDGLALVASGPAALPELQQAVLRQFTALLDSHGLPAVWQARQAMEAAAGQEPPAPEIQDFLARRFLANDPRSLIAMIDALCSATDQTELLTSLAPHTVVVTGDLDDVWPAEQQRDMAARLDADLVELPEVGHSPAVDVPDAVADAIASTLTRSV